MSFELDELLSLNKQLILYVGPELAQAAGLPDRAALLDGLLEHAASLLPEHQVAELRELAGDPQEPQHELFAAIERQLTAPSFGKAIERMLDDKGKPVPALAQAVARLAPRLHGVLTPNLDQLLERAFAGTLDVHASAVADLGTRSGWLYKLNGTLRDRSTWMFTSAQRRQALYVDPLHATLFRALFLMHTIVFVGTPIDDPLFVELADQVASISQGQPPQHYMLVEHGQVKPRHRRRLAEAGISLVTYNGPGALLELLGRLAGDSTPDRVPAAARASTPSPPARPRPLDSGKHELSILFVSANPAGTDPLRVQLEERIVRDAIAHSPNRARLSLVTQPAATFEHLRQALLHGSYDVVHVAGHSETDGLILEDAHGDCVRIAPKGLAMMFANYAAPAGRLRCVILNACYSVATGELIAMDVDYTIAMNGPISDQAALEFSQGFYDALGAGCDVPRAYREGRTCVAAKAPRARFDATLIEREPEDPETEPTSA
jgi:hypothetical protein